MKEYVPVTEEQKKEVLEKLSILKNALGKITKKSNEEILKSVPKPITPGEEYVHLSVYKIFLGNYDNHLWELIEEADEWVDWDELTHRFLESFEKTPEKIMIHSVGGVMSVHYNPTNDEIIDLSWDGKDIWTGVFDEIETRLEMLASDEERWVPYTDETPLEYFCKDLENAYPTKEDAD